MTENPTQTGMSQKGNLLARVIEKAIVMVMETQTRVLPPNFTFQYRLHSLGRQDSPSQIRASSLSGGGMVEQGTREVSLGFMSF